MIVAFVGFLALLTEVRVEYLRISSLKASLFILFLESKTKDK